jgi:hypothetical protein
MYPDPNQQNAPKPQPAQVPPQQPWPGAQQYPTGIPQPQTPIQPLAPPTSSNATEPQYSIDYLNQIAPKPQKSGLVGGRMFLFIIGGGLLLALIVGIMALSSSGNGPTKQMQTLAARIETLQSIADKSQKNIKSGKLRSTNSNLNIFLTNANHDIVDPLTKNGLDIKKIDKNIVAAEKGEDLTKKLEDARLNATFDETYARQMSYQLSTLETLMGTIYHSTKSKSMKDFLSKTDGNIEPIIKQLDNFNVTTAND